MHYERKLSILGNDLKNQMTILNVKLLTSVLIGGLCLLFMKNSFPSSPPVVSTPRWLLTLLRKNMYKNLAALQKIPPPCP